MACRGIRSSWCRIRSAAWTRPPSARVPRRRWPRSSACSSAVRERRAASLLILALALPLLVALAASDAQAPKAGGVLNARLREDLPQGFSIHETSTISTMWPAMPCFNNLVLFDPMVSTHSADAIVGELAERWSWQDNYRNLVFFLRAGVRWHDGAPFSSK